jgi:CRP/FNR family transcriptional regulator, cyclic AMP receptor protein
MYSSLPLEELAHVSVFHVLDALQKEAMLSNATRLIVPKSEYIYKPDATSDFLCLILKGMVKVGTYFPDGRELVRSIHHPGSIFGETCLTGEQRRPDFAISMNSEVDCLLIEKEFCKQLMAQNFDLMLAMTHYIGTRLSRAERQLENIVSKDVRSRIIAFLKENIVPSRLNGVDTLFKYGLTQQDIANIVGASRQTVAIILNDLRKNNQIDFDRESITIHDIEMIN